MKIGNMKNRIICLRRKDIESVRTEYLKRLTLIKYIEIVKASITNEVLKRNPPL